MPFLVQPIRATRHRPASFLETDSVNTARNVSRSPQSIPTCEDIPDYMNMSAQMLRAHASAKMRSPSVAVSDKPPLPGTTSMVF